MDRLACDQTTHHAHLAITQREYIQSTDHGIAGRTEPPRLGGGVGTDVRRAVFLQHEVRWSAVKDVLKAVAESLPPHDIGFRVQEPQVFDVRPLDSRAALFRVSLGCDLVLNAE